MITHVPDAIANGAEIRANCMVSRIHLGGNRRVPGISYFDQDGREHFQKARAVVVSGYAIETPRLLLNSACPGFENGLANSSDCVGRYLMAQAGNVVLGRFDELVRMYKAPPAHALTEELLRNRSEARLRARLRHSDGWAIADRIRQTDDDRERRLGMGSATHHDGLQSLGRLRPAG